MFATFLYYILLVDLTVISTKISAFALVCLRVLPEVGLFLGALTMAILTFSSANSVLKHKYFDFSGIHRGSFALIKMAMGVFDSRKYELLEEEPLLLMMVVVFLLITVIFFLNMLVAQLSCAYSSVYKDMLGYARLERAETIVDIMPTVNKQTWKTFLESLRLNKRLEFNQGDIGVAGGIQMMELANLNPTTVDVIRRFGGSTSVDNPWPEEDQEGESDDRFDRIEKLIQRTLERVTKSGSQSGSTTATMGATAMGATKQSSSDSDKSED
jgi:hypothetical protein